jgi:hypothetical protein
MLDFFVSCPQCQHPGPHHTKFVEKVPYNWDIEIHIDQMWEALESIRFVDHFERSCIFCQHLWKTTE